MVTLPYHRKDYLQNCYAAGIEFISELGVAQEGLANVCLVGRAVTLVRARVEANLPRKRGAAAAGYDKAISRFYEKVSSGVGVLNVFHKSYRCTDSGKVLRQTDAKVCCSGLTSNVQDGELPNTAVLQQRSGP